MHHQVSCKLADNVCACARIDLFLCPFDSEVFHNFSFAPYWYRKGYFSCFIQFLLGQWKCKVQLFPIIFVAKRLALDMLLVVNLF